jgi:ureidoglycolate lyase
MSSNPGGARVLVPEALTAEKFTLFGDVIDAASAARRLPINQGYTTRFDDLAAIDVGEAGGRICVSIFRSAPMARPVAIRQMERHPLGSQAFIPLDRRPYLVVVAPPGPFDAAQVRAFVAGGEQGVNYAKAVWHHFLLALDVESDFLVIDRTGPGDNLDEIVFADDAGFEIAY